MIKLVACVLVIGTSLAHAGPPELAHTVVTSLVATRDAVWMVGSDDCDEGGRWPFVAKVGARDDDAHLPMHELGRAFTTVAIAHGQIFIAPSQRGGTRIERVRDDRMLAPIERAEQLTALWTNGEVVIAIGKGGAISRSTDRGARWATIDSGANVDLTAIAGAAREVRAIGNDGTILVSRDAGATWAREPSGTHAALTGVWVGRAGLAVAVGGCDRLARDCETVLVRDAGEWFAAAPRVRFGDDVYTVRTNELARSTTVDRVAAPNGAAQLELDGSSVQRGGESASPVAVEGWACMGGARRKRHR
jgi:hypothetical protein